MNKIVHHLLNSFRRTKKPRFRFDPGGFMVCTSKRFLFVNIAKNGRTTINRLIYNCDVGQDGLSDDINDYFGYTIDGHRRISLKDARRSKYAEYLKFAVYRDPVERFLSLYKNQISSPKILREYFSWHNVIGASLDDFIEFTEQELRKPPLNQDEHIRPQSKVYRPNDVDFIVPIERLDVFMKDHFEIDDMRRYNSSEQRALRVTESQINRIKNMYADDYAITPETT